MRYFTSTCIQVLSFLCLCTAASAEVPVGNQLLASATYHSEVDTRLSISRITVLPGIDNTDGIYARAVQQIISDLVQSSHRWEFVDPGTNQLTNSALELEESPAVVMSLLKNINADAAFLPVISRGPKGLALRLELFLKSDGKMLAQELSKETPKFEMADVKARATKLFNLILGRLPYDGFILSRQGNRVTFNLGKADGVTPEMELTVVQIVAETRHPKFGFLLSTDKEILGRIKVHKVDDTLSFAMITSEKERGAVQKSAKIAGLRPVQYGDQALSQTASSTTLDSRPDSAVAFGEKAFEWLPIRSPTFGQVGLRAGLGQYAGAINLTGVGPLEAKSTFYPLLNISGEIWLNPQWSVMGQMTQAVLSTSNPRAGSSPSTLNMAMSQYDITLGYNFLIKNNFFGPKFQLRAGINLYRMYFDDSSPQSFTTNNYSGYLLGLGLYFPISDGSAWSFGGDFAITFMPKLTESPVQSGDSATNTVNQFSLFAEKSLAINLKARGMVDFSLFSSNLTGAGTRAEAATTISHRHTNFSAGMIYQF